MVAALGTRIDCTLDDAGELRRHIGPRGLNSGPLAALVRTANLAHGPCLHWIRAGDEVIEQDAEAVDVAPNRGPLPLQDLGCEIEGRSGEIRRGVVVELSARAEVHQHDAAVFGPHHVVRLDIPMQQAGAMHRRHRAAELETDADSLGGADHLSLVEDLLEGVAANELHPQADLIGNCSAPWMVTTFGCRTRASNRPSWMIADAARSPEDAFGRQEFQRDLAIEPRVPGPVDLSEGARGRSARRAEDDSTSPARPHRPAPPGTAGSESASMDSAGCCDEDQRLLPGPLVVPRAAALSHQSSIRQPPSRSGSHRGSRRRDRQSAAHLAARFISSGVTHRRQCGAAAGGQHRGCQPAGLVAVRETGLMWANMLRAFQVGKALTSDGRPSSWMRPSRVAWAQVSWPACHLTKASASAVM